MLPRGEGSEVGSEYYCVGRNGTGLPKKRGLGGIGSRHGSVRDGDGVFGATTGHGIWHPNPLAAALDHKKGFFGQGLGKEMNGDAYQTGEESPQGKGSLEARVTFGTGPWSQRRDVPVKVVRRPERGLKPRK